MIRGRHFLSSCTRWMPTSSSFFTPLRPSIRTSFNHSLRQVSTLPQRPSNKYRKLGYTAMVAAATTTTLYYTNEDCRHVITAFERCGVAGKVGVLVALDYKMTLSKHYDSEEASVEARKQCHLRCAHRVLTALQQLGGIYVKLGQHVSAMVYLLPVEWTSTMAVLQDRCDPTQPEDIRQLFLTDYGQPIEAVFDDFDWTPIGVASLAQVHKARLKSTGEWVAVKLQHPNLDDFCRIDMQTVSVIFDCIYYFFPDFGFGWLVEEMKESLPQEMNFAHEANNARQVAANFVDDKTTALVIPATLWALRRIMCMEFIEGARIDDLEYMKQHGIDPRAVSSELTRIFSEMIFLHGFVHCDPHPGNVIIRPSTKKHGHNFDLVLLDHGLYRTLPDQLRSDYAHLWTSLISGDEEGIRIYAHRVGGTDGYQLFASMLTGREWAKINNADLNSIREQEELGRMTEGALTFLVEVADILGKMPRTVLLLLKTNDLLRHVDEQLNVVPDERITYVIMGQYCSKAAWLDTRSYLIQQLKEIGWHWYLMKSLLSAWWHYQKLEYSLWFYQLATVVVDDIRTLCIKWFPLY
ncbi:ABC1 family-domain-containing protein [Halteromyces radiatus]|uniref:ABC1 family-domain-containing protein n=1 Tax=Halteromyces radiatus TaxID=101107 RepID=UPI002220AAF2|nr:ABC1 family-domain-containing protein [Halteromyces radiatus]KAI8079783.1 ABC1 family-domain-containing protein [Halteromyces radiatus]